MDLASGAVSAIIGVAGYVLTAGIKHVFSQMADQTATEERRRDDDLDRLETVVFEVRDTANDYWSMPGDGGAQRRREASIIGRLSFLGSIVSELFAEDPVLNMEVETALNGFHEACTGGSFGVVERHSEPEITQEIELFAYTFVHEARRCRRRLERSLI